mmetsp:Transcript_16200/g.44596  ORF Transcript_16200/g.44596 Transcript_16200/m.44596 type:complete len:253 (+) Transcript_16200:280-1038(+)
MRQWQYGRRAELSRDAAGPVAHGWQLTITPWWPVRRCRMQTPGIKYFPAARHACCMRLASDGRLPSLQAVCNAAAMRKSSVTMAAQAWRIMPALSDLYCRKMVANAVSSSGPSPQERGRAQTQRTPSRHCHTGWRREPPMTRAPRSHSTSRFASIFQAAVPSLNLAQVPETSIVLPKLSSQQPCSPDMSALRWFLMSRAKATSACMFPARPFSLVPSMLAAAADLCCCLRPAARLVDVRTTTHAEVKPAPAV